MDQGSTEKKLSIFYTLIVAFGATASITCGIAWGHWKQTLNQCVDNKNCSCILYADHTPTHFLGGSMAPCIWVTYGPLVYILLAIAFAGFHGFRVLFGTKVTRTITAKNEAGEVIQLRAVNVETTTPLPRAFWIVMSIFTVIFTIYSLVHFSVYIDGYLTTCKEYRKTLEKLLGAHGTVLPVVYNRLSCISIFDFMDYMQPDSGNAFRDGFINTGVDLTIGVTVSLLAWILFMLSAALNIKMARNKNE